MTVVDTDTFAQEWAAWHEEHEKRRASAHGFLAITSMRWLGEEPETYDDVPGAWSSGPEGIVVSLAPVLVDAINALIADGTYNKIFTKWDVSDIKLDKSEFNPKPAF